MKTIISIGMKYFEVKLKAIIVIEVKNQNL